MERIEYRDVIDKSDWARGPWDNEPDKIQWQDPATRLPCLIVRGPIGALCGYVGVYEWHPLFGVGYSECPKGEACSERKPDGDYQYCDHRPESALTVHGGLSFADRCHKVSPETWEEWRKGLSLRSTEAIKYPKGAMARAIKAWGPAIDNYDKYVERAKARFICHIDGENEPAVWWFGFDCAHCMDVTPMTTGLGVQMPDSEYRDIAYVEQECRNLAQQLADMIRQLPAPTPGEQA